MIRYIIRILFLLSIIACAPPSDSLKEGVVIAKYYNPAWIEPAYYWWYTGSIHQTTSSSQFHPATYKLTMQGTVEKYVIKRDVYVTEIFYNSTSIGDTIHVQ